MRKIILLAALTTASAQAQTVSVKSNQTWPTSNTTVTMNGGVAVKLSGTVENATIGPVTIVGAKHAVYTNSDADIIRNLTVQGLTVSQAQREGVRIRGSADGVVIRDFNIGMRSEPQVSPDLPTGILFYSGRNLRVENGRLSGFRMASVPGQYTNGDGLASENAVDGLTISDVTSDDNSDGGFDLKGRNITLANLSAARNYRSYRFWGSTNAGTLTSIDPRNAHLWAGTGATVVIDKLIARSTTPAVILYVDGAVSVTIRSCELTVPAGTKFSYVATKTTAIALGPGCVL
jgi:hypothetical protein